MKKTHPILFVLFLFNMICVAQTQLTYEKYLVEQYKNSLGTKFNQNNDLLIYPNPVINEFSIQNLSAPLASVEIFSLDGKMVMKSTIVNDKVVVSTLSKGVYFVKANNTFIRFVKI